QPQDRQSARPHRPRDAARHRRRGYSMIRRREFIAGLSSTAAWPLAARAQQPTKMRTIGFLGAATLSARTQWVDAFVQRLHELGWIEGRTVAIESQRAAMSGWLKLRPSSSGSRSMSLSPIQPQLALGRVDNLLTRES